MKFKIFPLLLLETILIATILNACSSGKKAYDRGNYYEAVMLSVKRLRQKPDHDKSIETLRNAYPLAIEYLEGQANNEINSNSAYKWKNVVLYYTQINQMYEQIRQCPACLRQIKNPKNYYSDMGPLKEKAAGESFDAGVNNLMKGNRNDAKQAYCDFMDAKGYVSNYKNVDEYLDKAKEAATLKVVVEQIPVRGQYRLSSVFFQDKVEEFLHNSYSETTYIRFYSAREANTIKLKNPDHIMRIQFDDFSVGNTIIKEKEETMTRDSVKVGQTKVNGKSIPVYNTVKAKLTTYRKEVISSGLLSMVIIDAKTNGMLSHKKFEGNYVWVNTWARFNGDERALLNEQLDWCKQKEQMPPLLQDLFLQFTKPLYDQLTPAIRGFYQNY